MGLGPSMGMGLGMVVGGSYDAPQLVAPSYDTQQMYLMDQAMSGPMVAGAMQTSGLGRGDKGGRYGGAYSTTNKRDGGGGLSRGAGPSIDTLYLGQLSADVREADARQLFASAEGFKAIKFVTKSTPRGQMGMCFAKYDTPALAFQANSKLQNVFIAGMQQPVSTSVAKNSLVL